MKILKEKKKNIRNEKRAEIADPEFISRTAPALGISFKDDVYIRTSDGYMACLYVYKYPSAVDDNWLYELTTVLSGTAAIIDIKPSDPVVVKKNISKSMEEQDSRFYAAKTHAAANEAQYRFNELNNMYDEISRLGKVMDQIIIRIIVPGQTMSEVDAKMRDVINALDRYKVGVCIAETKKDFEAILTPISRQQDSIFKKETQGVPSGTLAAGNPFHFSKLEDPCGFYWGKTDTGGSVLLDMFRSTDQRMSYNFFCSGMMGSGKSTLLKKTLEDRAKRGDFVRVFDVADEYRELVLSMGGKIISTDGESGNMINHLQIFKTDESDNISYNIHMSKMTTTYKYLRPDADGIEVLMFEDLLRQLYEERDIVRNNQIAIDIESFPVDEYPIYSDLLAVIDRRIRAAEENDKMATADYSYLTNIQKIVMSLCSTYGNIFNGHTTLKEIFKEQILCFDIKSIKNMKLELFSAIVYNILLINWSNAVENGSKMKDLFEKHKITAADAVKTLILIDEVHLWLNAKSRTGIDQVSRFEREGRKYFCGIGLATQQVSDLVPDGASAEGIDEMKTLFNMSTYKFFMRQAENERNKIQEVSKDGFNDSELTQMMTLDRGETLLSIAGYGNLKFTVAVTEEELSMYRGGV